MWPSRTPSPDQGHPIVGPKLIKGGAVQSRPRTGELDETSAWTPAGHLVGVKLLLGFLRTARGSDLSGNGTADAGMESCFQQHGYRRQLCSKYAVSWLTTDGRHVSKGLKKCQRSSFKFPNFSRAELLLRIIRHEKAPVEFAKACWMSPLLEFRVPSEKMHLVRAYMGR